MQTFLNVDHAPAHWACDTVRLVEQATLHLFHLTRFVATKQFRPEFGLLQDVGCHPAANLSVADT